jgi:hypothetical protein
MLDREELTKLERALVVSVLATEEPEPTPVTDDEGDANPMVRTLFVQTLDRRERHARLLGAAEFQSERWIGRNAGARDLDVSISKRADASGVAMLDRLSHGFVLTTGDRELLRRFRFLLEDEIAHGDALARLAAEPDARAQRSIATSSFSAVGQSPGRKRRASPGQNEERVARAIQRFDDRGVSVLVSVSRSELAVEAGISSSSVDRTAAWKKVMEYRREFGDSPRARRPTTRTSADLDRVTGSEGSTLRPHGVRPKNQRSRRP